MGGEPLFGYDGSRPEAVMVGKSKNVGFRL